MLIVIGKPGDPCVEGDGRASIEGWWCGACHMAAQREQIAYAEIRAEEGSEPCNWFERMVERAAALRALGREVGDA